MTVIDEIEFLKSMYAPSVKRTTDLIVSQVSYEGNEGWLNNGHWDFKVPYAFRDALDIKYEKRIRDKAPTMVWTQGPLLRFQDGDTLQSTDGTRAVQVRFANPMGWDKIKNETYEGSVTYDEFEVTSNGTWKKIDQKHCTQMHF